MASEGAAVVVADLNRPEAERIAGELDTAVAVEVDVADEESVAQMVKTAVASFGGLDVLHNNATDSSLNAVDTDIVTLDMEVFDRLVAVNLKGQFVGCKYASPSMLARGGGSVVNTRQSTGSSAVITLVRAQDLSCRRVGRAPDAVGGTALVSSR